ncbi:reticulon-like protein B5 isoform X3 [Citrus sinensis]|uniref:reticulon-like protein B5 isoform X3 n=1 Tax=Citrus sinensis TaxID=2711 RepID=UPI0003D74274|nr:reticulon-like protein B5 isoform X3 [Citrus sinensis]
MLFGMQGIGLCMRVSLSLLCVLWARLKEDDATAEEKHETENQPADGATAEEKNETENKTSISGNDSDIDKNHTVNSSGKNRLFGRQKPVHHVLGGGKCADVLLWRNRQISAGILASGTVIWFFFECVGYHLVTFICHSIILTLSTLFLWSNLAAFTDMSPPQFPEIKLPEDLFVRVALYLRCVFNVASKMCQDVTTEPDIRKFLTATLVLWVISIIGSWFDFLTILYLVFVVSLTLPMLYEKHEDLADTCAEKALVELKKQYAVLDQTVLQKLPISAVQRQHRS